MLTFRHRLDWADVDYARIALYLRYYVWIDTAFHGYLYDHGFRIKEFVAQGFGLPYLSTSCRYLRPLTIEDEIEIALSVPKLDDKGFTLRYSIANTADGAIAGEGEIIRRCIQVSPPRSVPMPEVLREAVAALAGT